MAKWFARIGSVSANHGAHRDARHRRASVTQRERDQSERVSRDECFEGSDSEPKQFKVFAKEDEVHGFCILAISSQMSIVKLRSGNQLAK